jgi:flagellin
VGANSADTGIYRLSADTAAKTVTLKRFDVDGETLMGSETISKPDGLGAGRYTTLAFEDLGVSLTISNSADRSITLGDLESGLEKDLTVATSRMASLIGEDGPKFQTGVASRNDFTVGAFRDMRMGKNTDGEYGSLFNEVNDLILSMATSTDPTTASFQRLENKVEDMIDVVSAQRSDFGAIQNRLTAAINNITEQYANLTAAKSQIEDTDFAWETARLTKLQIGQQAATAMLAQANAIPNVIMALIE